MSKKFTLEQHRVAEKRRACKVCKLPPWIRKQIRERKKEVRAVMVVSWLKGLGHDVSEKAIIGHLRGGHEPLPRRR